MPETNGVQKQPSADPHELRALDWVSALGSLVPSRSCQAMSLTGQIQSRTYFCHVSQGAANAFREPCSSDE